MPHFRLALTLSVVAALAACGAGQQDPRVPVLEGKVAELEKKIADLEFQASLQSDMKKWENVAYLTPGSSGYNVVRMDLGVLTVSISNIQPYANGSRVSLVFGNLTSAAIDGMKAKIEWGSVDDKGLPNNTEAKSREITPTELLQPGSWNKVDVILEGVPPSSLGFVRVRDVGHRAIRLRGKGE
ncbi:MAG: DUF3251 domain-containing protein [Burkholderiaceae bacterium]|nr:DUF3251 domain-containing protein [Burkholderiaceae bacterium]